MNSNHSENNNMYRLPIEAYTSEEWFKKEQATIFANTWQFAGFVEDLSQVGDHLCAEIGPYHMIIVKDEQGHINAFHSVCKHRGNRVNIVVGDQKKLLKCPYHNWTYTLQGALAGVPEKRSLQPFTPSNHGLTKASVAIWKTLIFVHPLEDAPSFKEWIQDIEGHMGPHKPHLLQEYHDNNSHYLCHCNWKIFAENYMDGYHLAYLHDQTLNMYDHKQQKSQSIGGHWTFFEPLTDNYKKNLYKYGYTPINHLKEDALGAYVHFIFPNLGISESESTWSTLKLIPLAPNLTLLISRARVMPSVAKASKWFQKKKKSTDPIKVSDYPLPLESLDFMIEDMYVCENIQKNMDNGTFKAGPMHTEKEEALSCFQQAILDFMIEEDTSSSL